MPNNIINNIKTSIYPTHFGNQQDLLAQMFTKLGGAHTYTYIWDIFHPTYNTLTIINTHKIVQAHKHFMTHDQVDFTKQYQTLDKYGVHYALLSIQQNHPNNLYLVPLVPKAIHVLEKSMLKQYKKYNYNPTYSDKVANRYLTNTIIRQPHLSNKNKTLLTIPSHRTLLQSITCMQLYPDSYDLTLLDKIFYLPSIQFDGNNEQTLNIKDQITYLIILMQAYSYLCQNDLTMHRQLRKINQLDLSIVKIKPWDKNLLRMLYKYKSAS